MDTAIVIGASGGIGSALCQALEAQGTRVIGLSRSISGLDVTNEASIAKNLGALKGPFEGLFIATGALEINGAAPEKSLKQVTSEAMMAQFALNTVGPALCLKHGLPLIARNRRAVIGVLTARVGSIEDNRLGGWYSYRSAKAGANQVVRSTAIEVARSHPHAICVALHPGTVATEFTKKYLARHPAVAPRDAAKNLLRVVSGLTPRDSGGFFDYAGDVIPY